MKNKVIVFAGLMCLITLQGQLSYSLSNKFWRLKYAKINDKEYSFNGSNDNAPTMQISGANLRGNGGCNAYHSKFTIDGYSMDIGNIMSTRMACNEMYLQESDYFEALAQHQTIDYSEGSSELTLTNSQGDRLVFFAQFSRSAESYIPPANRMAHAENDYSATRHRHRYYRYAPIRISKREQTRQNALERKLKRGKLSKREKSELHRLQKKSSQITRQTQLEKKSKRARLSKRERRELKSLHAQNTKKSRVSKKHHRGHKRTIKKRRR